MGFGDDEGAALQVRGYEAIRGGVAGAEVLLKRTLDDLVDVE